MIAGCPYHVSRISTLMLEHILAQISVAIANLWASEITRSVCSLKPPPALVFNKVGESSVKDSLCSECFQEMQEVTQ